MDRPQLPKGYRATTRRHLLLATKFPEIPGTHLIDFTRWNAGWTLEPPSGFESWIGNPSP